MRVNTFAKKLRDGDVLLGLCNMYPAAGIVEGMCSGWDFVWLDGQHGQMSYDALLHAAIAAKASGIESMIRVPGHESSFLGLYADIAPSAIMVPMVNNAEQAGDVVEGLRFPPLGNRSYGGRRVIDLDGRDYYKDRELVVVAQIETVEAVENAADIIATAGVDALFFGPDDMKVQMNLPINTSITDSKEIRAAMKTTVEAARNAGKYAGCVAANAATATMATEMGYQILVGGGDIAFLRVAAADRLTELRNATGGASKPQPVVKQGSGLYGG